MQVVRWGSSLAVRIPSELVERWELGEGRTCLQDDAAARRAAIVAPKTGLANLPRSKRSTKTAPVEDTHRATVGKWGNSLAVRLPQPLTNLGMLRVRR